MSLKNYGTNTSEFEVISINKNGIWIYLKDKEYFIPFNDFPMLKDIPTASVFNAKYNPPEHIYWEEYDIDIELSSLENMEVFPLVFKK